MSKETFKEFIRNKPELTDFIDSGEMTWQKFYELYDLYGEEETVWRKYKTPKKNLKVQEIIDKFNPETLQKHLTNAQKALDVFSEFATKGTENIANKVKPNIERPLNKFFGD